MGLNLPLVISLVVGFLIENLVLYLLFFIFFIIVLVEVFIGARVVIISVAQGNVVLGLNVAAHIGGNARGCSALVLLAALLFLALVLFNGAVLAILILGDALSPLRAVGLPSTRSILSLDVFLVGVDKATDFTLDADSLFVFAHLVHGWLVFDSGVLLEVFGLDDVVVKLHLFGSFDCVALLGCIALRDVETVVA